MTDLTIIDIAPLFDGDNSARRVIHDYIVQAAFETGGFAITRFADADRVDERASTLLAFFSNQ